MDAIGFTSMAKKLISVLKGKSIPYLIQIGHPKHIAKFFKNPKYHIDLAEFGTDEHRDRLIKSKNPEVRKTVAMFGNSKHRQQLLNDKDPVVRSLAAYYNGDVYEE
jgi:hypothetical protein